MQYPPSVSTKMHHNLLRICLNRWRTILSAVLMSGFVYIEISALLSDDDMGDMRLKIMREKYEALKMKHVVFVSNLHSSTPGLRIFDDCYDGNCDCPSEDYEYYRRRVRTNIEELWFFIRAELGKLRRRGVQYYRIPDVLLAVEARERFLLSLLDNLSQSDGYAEWRQRTATATSDLLQRRLHRLQNPRDCDLARKLVCPMLKECGFGCRIHNLIYCMIFAYATERTLVGDYSGLETKHHFQLSDTCLTYNQSGQLEQYNRATEKQKRILAIPYIDYLYPKKDYQFLPLSIPEDLAPLVTRFNGDPSSWWIGQMLKFILKPRPDLQRTINETIAKLDFKKPIVGVHIRRTDKVYHEAAYHHLREYMSHVGHYYDTLQLTQTVRERRVYLATDDVHVLKEAREKYKEYTFITAGVPSQSRRSDASLAGLLADVTLLARTDYLVCTFSSQVGRLAYELMQSNRVDASNSFSSLDDIYYFGGQIKHHREAVIANKPKNDHILTTKTEIAFEVGDLLGVAGNLWNGYGDGSHKKNRSKGLIPWFKTRDHIVVYPFPVYPERTLDSSSDIHQDWTKHKNDKTNVTTEHFFSYFYDGIVNAVNTVVA